MNICIKNLFVLRTLITGLGLMLAGRVTAQTFTMLHGFSEFYNGSFHYNSGGARPYAGLLLSRNTLYGTTEYGGNTTGDGVVFAIYTNGTGFINLYTFTVNDGGWPLGGLIVSGNSLYGTLGANIGSAPNNGSVFQINLDGTAFTNLCTFSGYTPNTLTHESTNFSGGSLTGSVILSGNTLYGTASLGGTNGFGTVFAVGTNGAGFKVLHTFTGVDGSQPYARVILSGNSLYGTTQYGGAFSNGTVFAVNLDGTEFTNLHSFTSTTIFDPTNSDGANPRGGLTISENKLYGTAPHGGAFGQGIVFKVSTGGSGFTNLHSFGALGDNSSISALTNDDGATPYAGLILSGQTLYGTAATAGLWGSGTIFAVSTDGIGFTNLHNFTPLVSNTNSDGASPFEGLILSDNTLYGTAFYGGPSGNGTVFSLGLGSVAVLSPQLNISRSGTNVVLAWPTRATGFTLQSSTNLGSSEVWTTNSPAPVVVNGQNTVTNPISGTQVFFRLSQ